jgi:nitrate reductase NapE
VQPARSSRLIEVDRVSNSAHDADETTSQKRRMEIYAFLIVTAVLMPAVAVTTVGTWGLTVWIYQAINGPPGPPTK